MHRLQRRHDRRRGVHGRKRLTVLAQAGLHGRPALNYKWGLQMKFCRKVTVLLTVLYLLALALFGISYFELFGQQGDPLSAVFLVLLGTPWTQMIQLGTDPQKLALVILAPVVNLAILWVACGLFRHRR